MIFTHENDRTIIIIMALITQTLDLMFAVAVGGRATNDNFSDSIFGINMHPHTHTHPHTLRKREKNRK